MPIEIKYLKKNPQTTCSLMFLNGILNWGGKMITQIIMRAIIV